MRHAALGTFNVQIIHKHTFNVQIIHKHTFNITCTQRDSFRIMALVQILCSTFPGHTWDKLDNLINATYDYARRYLEYILIHFFLYILMCDHHFCVTFYTECFLKNCTFFKLLHFFVSGYHHLFSQWNRQIHKNHNLMCMQQSNITSAASLA